MDRLHVTNSLTRQKEPFEPIHPPLVGMYVCGPTVYGHAHLGHARSAITFDLVFRYLTYLGYKVRYVRNITDVGHLENDADEGESKVEKQARIQQLEPMEVAQMYMDSYTEDMARLNLLRPSIEPRATGHIPEQIEAIEQIIRNGYAYVINGSVYFDVPKYNQDFAYGKLSGRDLEQIIAGSRDNLEGGAEKRHPADFALWKKASPAHLMRWNSPWSVGFPGWHIECTVMSTKYLGTKYDIHGGGMDLLFPHHEAEIAQSNGCNCHLPAEQQDEARYWLHNNMITYEGKKMGKSLGNAIGLRQFFSGDHPLLQQAYSPLTIRFFMLQAHYRSTLDFSNEALQAAEKALKRMAEAIKRLDQTRLDLPAGGVDPDLEHNCQTFLQDCQAAMNDDFNTARVVARMFDALPAINQVTIAKNTSLSIHPDTFTSFREAFKLVFYQWLGLQTEADAGQNTSVISGLMQLLIEIRLQARREKNWAVADRVRAELSSLGIRIDDTPDGAEWHFDR